jgi:hypothetical protein
LHGMQEVAGSSPASSMERRPRGGVLVSGRRARTDAMAQAASASGCADGRAFSQAVSSGAETGLERK